MSTPPLGATAVAPMRRPAAMGGGSRQGTAMSFTNPLVLPVTIDRSTWVRQEINLGVRTLASALGFGESDVCDLGARERGPWHDTQSKRYLCLLAKRYERTVPGVSQLLVLGPVEYRSRSLVQ